ncbi:hypothetical protein ACFQ3P_13735 [Paraburkholderia sabiae]|uniref:DUF1843 domain-containing protein n=1 Tax=Paraburkholderia sabiae TaxID=273251 RepID=A0ABU9QD41_9BURK|nr:hypothetical protein [Paraburkholderia sabiae]WJZ76160.1 hypothetical protein QEN71_10275 [Paraburkholderia sabiae]CAD6526060.1 hypothetical protein LMG24235_01914 [Paraburkholderia sabiae]
MKTYIKPHEPDPAREGDMATIRFAVDSVLKAIHDAELLIKASTVPSDDYAAALDRLEAARRALSG